MYNNEFIQLILSETGAKNVKDITYNESLEMWQVKFKNDPSNVMSFDFFGEVYEFLING
jgi:hypothetical protein